MNKDKLAGQLTNHYEGTRLKPYVDSVGKLTIGVGRNLTDKGISPNEAAILLDNDLNDTIAFLNTHLPWWTSLNEVRQRALANMTFDLMGKILQFKKMLAALQAGLWSTASTELLTSLFATQTGQRAKDIAQMFLTGEDV